MKAIDEVRELRAEHLKTIIEGRERPLVLRELVSSWPLVLSATESFALLAKYLLQFDQGISMEAMISHPDENGRFFYNKDFTGFNFKCQRATLQDALKVLAALRNRQSAPGFYIGSAKISSSLPGLRKACGLSFINDEVEPNIWLGNKTCVAIHNDVSQNIACVAGGRRRFTLFPPDQGVNLYIEREKPSPAGRPISLVNLRSPDFNEYPRYTDALEAGCEAELGPGDAIFIPTGWWHGVEALDDVNLLINYWWKASESASDLRGSEVL